MKEPVEISTIDHGRDGIPTDQRGEARPEKIPPRPTNSESDPAVETGLTHNGSRVF